MISASDMAAFVSIDLYGIASDLDNALLRYWQESNHGCSITSSLSLSSLNGEEER